LGLSIPLSAAPARADLADQAKTESDSLQAHFKAADAEVAKLEARFSGVVRTESCLDRFHRLYSRGEATFRIVYGYGDSRPSSFVSDSVEKAQLIYGLTTPCTQESVHTCGFSVVSQDPVVTVIAKEFEDPEGNPRRLKLEIANASLSIDDDGNRGPNRDAQNARSDQLDQLFISGFYQVQGLFYLGHNRIVGGPDFHYPRLRKNGHVNYLSYRHDRPGVQLLRHAVPETGSELQMLGLFGCHSKHTVLPILENNAPTPGLTVFSAPVEIDEQDQALELHRILNGAMTFRCEREYYQFRHKADIAYWLPFFEVTRQIFDIREMTK
jgi:hypothetical protein